MKELEGEDVVIETLAEEVPSCIYEAEEEFVRIDPPPSDVLIDPPEEVPPEVLIDPPTAETEDPPYVLIEPPVLPEAFPPYVLIEPPDATPP